MKTCYQCGEELKRDGECPNGCTDNPDYYAGDPAEFEEGEQIDPDCQNN